MDMQKIQPGLVSVIIPCYNAAKTLIETVYSVINQTYKIWEIIIVNDGSTDNSFEIAQQLKNQTQATIKIITTANKGVSHARNTGVANAEGEYLAFLDADDIWYAHKLEKQVQFFQTNPQLGVCYSKVHFISPTGQASQQYSFVDKLPLTPFDLLVENHLCTSSNIMCRTQAFIDAGAFKVGMNYAEDQEWLLRISLNGKWQIQGLNEVLIDYRTQTGSLSSSLSKMETGWLNLVENIRQYAPEFINQNYAKAQAIYLRYLARRALRQGEAAGVGLNYMKRAFISDWKLAFYSPWRTLATLIGLLCWKIMPNNYTAQIFKISKPTG